MLLAWLWRDTIPTFAGVQPSGSQVHSDDGFTPVGEPTSLAGGGSLPAACLEKMFPDSS